MCVCVSAVADILSLHVCVCVCAALLQMRPSRGAYSVVYNSSVDPDVAADAEGVAMGRVSHQLMAELAEDDEDEEVVVGHSPW